MTALDLLELPWTFTQRHLLDAGTFESECLRRGLPLRTGQLMALDAAGVLRPLFEMGPSGGGVMLQGGTKATKDAVAAGSISVRMSAAHPGPWPSHASESRVFYSQYQLLAVPHLLPFLDAMHLPDEYDLMAGLPWTLDGIDVRRLAPMQKVPLVSERLIVLLSVLEPVWLPSIVGRLSMPFLTETPEDRLYSPEEFTELEEAYHRSYLMYRHTVPAAELLDWFNGSVEETADQIEDLFRTADDVDPLGAWLEVVRMAPGRWNELKREIVVALDHRIAAELLLLFLHQLSDEGKADVDVYDRAGTFAVRHARSRLISFETNRDGVLTDFDLSPHPLSLVVLEGETEQLLAPRLMHALGIPAPSWPIRLINGESVDAKLDWIFRYVSTLEVHEELLSHGFRPSRPIPHIFVVSDAEGTRKTAPARETYRRKIINHLCKDAESATGRSIPRSLFDERVRVEAWAGGTFEFAHFDNRELAAAIRAQAAGLDAQLEAELVVERSKSLPRVSAVWHRLRIAGRIERDLNKRTLADDLWPALEARITAARSREELQAIPLAKTILDAYEPAGSYPWGHRTYIASVPPDPANS